jgi:hypothetical protein
MHSSPFHNNGLGDLLAERFFELIPAWRQALPPPAVSVRFSFDGRRAVC